MMSGAESPSPSSSPQPTRESNELQNDSDSLDTRNGEEINLEEDPDQYEERFRVDRRKLEQMLHGNQNGPSTEAEDFFLEVMESTNTQITWPSKLKKGAKSKKDPHIKVQGDPENVKKAKEKIMAVLDTKSNRVTLKMDVSHTEHSHVIGKGGNNIKRVMEDTRCHIHFPDSNRNNQSDKSNQVSIAGQPYGVECARMKIRELLPIAFIFDIPLTGLMQIQLDQTSPVITRIQQQYNVTVVFKQRPRALSTMAVVRGTVLNAKALKEATLLLMEHLTGNVGTLLPVSLQLEVAAQHHLFMVGRGGSNLQQIMAKTGASICFPDLTSGIPSAKGTILISGSIDNVLTARECIIGCLPLVLMFDLKEDVQCDQIYMNALMEKLDVFISVKPKPKQPSKSVVVKSIEENVANMYEARRLLLGLEKEEMPPQTASTRINTHITPSVQGLLAHNLLNIATAQSKPYVLLNQHPLSPLASPRQTAAAAHLSAAVAAAVGGQTNPNWLAAAHAGLVNPALMMIPTSVAMNGQQHNIHEIRKAMTSSPAAVSPTAAQVQTATPYTTIVKDLNENSSLACNANITSLQHSPNYINTPTDHKSQFLKSTSTPASPQHLQTANRYSPGNGSCAINGGGRSHSPNTNNMSSLVNQQQQQQPQSMIAAHQPPSQAPLHNHMDLELLTKTLKKDLNLNSSGAHLMEMGQKLHRSGSGADLRGIHQRAQQVAAARSPAPSRRSFSLSMSLNASRGSVSEAAAASMNGSSDLMYDKKAPGIERLADRMLNNDRLMASAHDRLMSSQNERLMASANRNSLMKPPPGLVQPAPNGGAVNPANVSAALADYERKKVMASKAIEQEPSGETRNPTDFWSGLGFSRSMPDSVIRDRLKQNGVRYDGPNMATTYEQQESDEDGDPWKDSSNHGNQQLPQELINKIEVYGDILSTSLGRTTNPIEPPAPPPPQVPVSTPENSDMAELFRKLGLDKYTDLFLQQEIDLATFATLNDQDLKELGISTFGARKKMLLAIADLQKSRQKYFSPTPGSNNPFRSTSASDGPFPFRHDMISRSGRW